MERRKLNAEIVCSGSNFGGQNVLPFWQDYVWMRELSLCFSLMVNFAIPFFPARLPAYK